MNSNRRPSEQKKIYTERGKIFSNFGGTISRFKRETKWKKII